MEMLGQLFFDVSDLSAFARLWSLDLVEGLDAKQGDDVMSGTATSLQDPCTRFDLCSGRIGEAEIARSWFRRLQDRKGELMRSAAVHDAIFSTLAHSMLYPPPTISPSHNNTVHSR